MSTQWYFSREGQNFGPYSWDKLRGFVASGEGMPGWIPAGEVKGLLHGGFDSSPAQPMGDPGRENIIGIIPAMHRKSGLLSVKSYHLVVTERRIIFAEAAQQMFNQAVKEANEESKAQGKGFFRRAADALKSSERIYKKYWQMAPEAILAGTPGNFAVELGDILAVRVIRQSGLKIGIMVSDDNQQKKDEMHIQTAREKIKLTFAGSGSGEAKKLLQELLGKTVRSGTGE